MHFEILIEDKSGQIALVEILVPKIIGPDHTFRIHGFKGIGKIPRDLHKKPQPGKRFLLEQLPRLLRGYGKTFAGYSGSYRAAVIVVADLDDTCLKTFRQQLFQILETCNPSPETRFCIAIEEGEAWFLGDLSAVRKAYPAAKEDLLASYVNDAICGTWEKLADAVFPGGSSELAKQGWQTVGKVKGEWAKKITPHMAQDNDNSPSFCYFRKKLSELAAGI